MAYVGDRQAEHDGQQAAQGQRETATQVGVLAVGDRRHAERLLLADLCREPLGARLEQQRVGRLAGLDRLLGGEREPFRLVHAVELVRVGHAPMMAGHPAVPTQNRRRACGKAPGSAGTART